MDPRALHPAYAPAYQAYGYLARYSSTITVGGTTTISVFVSALFSLVLGISGVEYIQVAPGDGREGVA